MSGRYFDDFAPGDRFQTAGVTLTGAAIAHFAGRFDPQPVDGAGTAVVTDSESAGAASGVHTLALSCRLFIDAGVLAACSLGSPGLDDLRWRRPARAGDTLHVEAEVQGVRPSASRPERGWLRMYYALVNQRGEVVLDYTLTHMLARRPGTAAPAR